VGTKPSADGDGQFQIWLRTVLSMNGAAGSEEAYPAARFKFSVSDGPLLLSLRAGVDLLGSYVFSANVFQQLFQLIYFLAGLSFDAQQDSTATHACVVNLGAMLGDAGTY
jgi:hypothetical protein